MAEFLLVHGSCHGAWCWRDVIPALDAFGHRARAIDLPGHGDGREAGTVTLDETCRAVAEAATEQSILVGHSWGGFPITGALSHMEVLPRGLIYLCAYLPKADQSLIDMRRAGPRQTIGSAAQKSGDEMSYTIVPEAAPELFYHDCTKETVAFALRHLCAQPIPPQATPLAFDAKWNQLPRAYIRCTEDRTIPPEYQEMMQRELPAEARYEMESSHSPFFGAPDRLAALLNRIAADHMGA